MAVFQYSSLLNMVATTATSGGTTTLVNTSATLQVFTGTANQTVVLPNATTFTTAGVSYQIYNQSTGSVQVNMNGGGALQTVPAGSTLITNLINNGSSAGSWTTLTNSSAPTFNAPTVQKFLTGSGTYTTPTSPAPLYIRVRAVGAGGGGGEGGNAGNSGSAGGATTFGSALLSAGGGAGGSAGENGGSSPGGAGGTSSLGSGPLGLALTGGSGASGQLSAGSASYLSGGNGGSSALGGAGGGASASNNGTAGAANTGGGGGGGGTGNTADFGGGSGGGSGGFIDAIITAPASTYAYTVGTGGAGGSGVDAGGAGGSGLIVVEEHYQ